MMPLMVDPNKDVGGDFVSPGRKLAMAVGIRRWTASTGTPMLTMGFVVLQDGDSGADNGRIFMEKFAMTQKAVFRIAGWAQAQGWSEPFNAESDDHIQKIMARGPVVAILVEETYDGKVRAVVDSFAPFSGSASPDWDAVTTAGEQQFERIQTVMAAKASGDPASNSDGGNAAHPNAPGNGAGMPF